MGMNVVAAYLLLKLGTYAVWMCGGWVGGVGKAGLGPTWGVGERDARAGSDAIMCCRLMDPHNPTPMPINAAGKEPSAADISAVISSVGAEADAAQVELLLKELDGKVCACVVVSGWVC